MVRDTSMAMALGWMDEKITESFRGQLQWIWVETESEETQTDMLASHLNAAYPQAKLIRLSFREHHHHPYGCLLQAIRRLLSA